MLGTPPHDYSSTCGGVRRWTFCDRDGIWKLMASSFRFNGACCVSCGSLAFFFSSLFLSLCLEKGIAQAKKKLLSSYCFGISDLVLFFVIVWFSYWLNFKFVFYFTLIEILIFFVFFFYFTLKSNNVICLPFFFVWHMVPILLHFFFWPFVKFSFIFFSILSSNIRLVEN